MTDKIHQQSGTEYQVRINGSPVIYYNILSNDLFDHYAKVCADNPNDYVDIVAVRTEILMNQHTYSQMQRHFCKA